MKFICCWQGNGKRTAFISGAARQAARPIYYKPAQRLALNHGLSAGYVDCAKQSLHQDLSDYAWLAIDNVETLDEDDQFQLFALFNHARERQRLIVAGSAPAKQLPLRADLTTRLSWGLTFELKGLNDDDKAEALCRHAQRRGLSCRLRPPVIY